MNFRVSELVKYTASTIDNQEGQFVDFLFDDRDFVVRYGVVQTGDWLAKRNVLISTAAVDSFDHAAKRIHTVLTENVLRDSPQIDVNSPVGRHLESQLVSYFLWPKYWSEHLVTVASQGSAAFQVEEAAEADFDHVLRSASQITGHSVEGVNEHLGVIDDLIIDLETGAIRYVVITTGNWHLNQKALIATDWINDFRWHSRSLQADLSRDQIKAAPEYRHAQPIRQEYVDELFLSLGRPQYGIKHGR